MPTTNLTVQGLLSSIRIRSSYTRTGGTAVTSEDAPAAGLAGSLTTRTNDTTGTLTMGAAHGLVENQVVDLYWTGGMRAGITIGAVNGTSVPISGGSGSILPTLSSAIVVGVRRTVEVPFDGDDKQLIAYCLNKRGYIRFLDGDDVEIADTARELVASEGWFWLDDHHANPFAGVSVAKLQISCGVAIAPRFQFVAH